VIPVSAGVTDQEQASSRREQVDAGGPDRTADRVDDDVEALARQACRQLSGIDDLVVGQSRLLCSAQVAGADGTDDPGGAELAGDAREAGSQAAKGPCTRTRSPSRMWAIWVSARYAVAPFDTTATASAGSRLTSFSDATYAASLTKIAA
jgi:hypothetical protein